MDPIAERFLERWHPIVDARDAAALPEVLREDVCFRSPFFFAPQRGRDYLVPLLGQVMEVFEDFTYHREMGSGRSLSLEFSARIGELEVKGIDLIELDEEGRIAELEVFVRPMNGLQAAGTEMMRRLAGA